MDEFHVPVLVSEVLDYLAIQPGNTYIDATVGGGGHGIEIVKQGGILLGIDVDNDAIKFVTQRWRKEARSLNGNKSNVTIVRGNFADIDRIAEGAGFQNVSGILFDLGVSSHQLDTPARGFSFRLNGPLDMRMDTSLAVRALDLVNGLTRKELEELFARLGEEPKARIIARKITEERRKRPIDSTDLLAQIVEKVYGGRTRDIHPATTVFQAIRIAVNDELNTLENALPKSFSLLKEGGRLAVISFHSLEDRIVKDYYVTQEKKGMGKILTKKPVTPTDWEIAKNRRSRSAKLRVFEKGVI